MCALDNEALVAFKKARVYRVPVKIVDEIEEAATNGTTVPLGSNGKIIPKHISKYLYINNTMEVIGGETVEGGIKLENESSCDFRASNLNSKG